MAAEAPTRAEQQAPPQQQAQAAQAHEHRLASPQPLMLRRCACGGTTGADGECAACKARRLQRKAQADAKAGTAPSIVHDVLRGQGKPLDAPVRGDMERRLGHDFSHVRVHTDSRAAASAQAVEAQAYTVGRNVVFGSGSYAPGSSSGRDLLAHELAHVVQQRGATSAPGALRIGAANDPAEAAADRAAAGRGSPGVAAAGVQLQRKVVVSPPGGVAQVISHLNGICSVPQITDGGAGVLAVNGCGIVAPGNGCDCVCDVLQDASRTYTINVSKATISRPNQTLWDGTTGPVPKTSMGPNTDLADPVNPTIDFPDTSSDAEFGSFQASGTAVWAPMWRILAHELCGHGRLKQSYAGGPGNRQQHDVTIDTENAIAAEHGGPPRGHFADPKPPGKQGESYFNPKGDQSKVVYSQVNGLHYEAP
jgi:hypothetical protein